MTDYLDNSNKKSNSPCNWFQVMAGSFSLGGLKRVTSEPIPTLIFMWKWQKRRNKAKSTPCLLPIHLRLVGLAVVRTLPVVVLLFRLNRW